MEYTYSQTLKFDENDIIYGVLERSGNYIMEQISNIEEDTEISSHQVSFEIPTRETYSHNGHGYDCNDWTSIEIVLHVGYSPKNEHLFHVVVRELIIHNDDFYLTWSTSDALSIAEGIEHSLRGMFLQKYGK